MKTAFQKKAAFLVALSLSLASASGAWAEQIQFSSKDITCMSCAGKVKKALKKNPAVKAVSVDENTMKVTVDLKKGRTLSDAELQALMVPTNFKISAIERN